MGSLRIYLKMVLGEACLSPKLTYLIGYITMDYSSPGFSLLEENPLLPFGGRAGAAVHVQLKAVLNDLAPNVGAYGAD